MDEHRFHFPHLDVECDRVELGNRRTRRPVLICVPDRRNVSVPLHNSPGHDRNGCRSLTPTPGTTLRISSDATSTLCRTRCRRDAFAPRFRVTRFGLPPAVREVSAVFNARLDEACRVEPVRGFGGHVGFIKRGTGPGWALVGDAGYFKDPLTAHGITDALRDAELLARAIMKGTIAAFADYEKTRL